MTDVGAARNAPPCMALDIGATKVEAALVARDGTLRARSRISDADHHDDLITGSSNCHGASCPKDRSTSLVWDAPDR